MVDAAPRLDRSSRKALDRPGNFGVRSSGRHPITIITGNF
ncbi:hypothetical protein I545_0250 [Mycobacterium kansasii 662]|uniref:Uncharacterized protein n=1 Tax=Mycobacterium kansasii 662 TaxID=1299326 RepID=X7ZTA6_MYCKA|nr:hypothetical protein I545_0250 [Mycobacterium kansasii 662]